MGRGSKFLASTSTRPHKCNRIDALAAAAGQDEDLLTSKTLPKLELSGENRRVLLFSTGHTVKLMRCSSSTVGKKNRKDTKVRKGQQRKGVPIGWLAVSGCPAASSLAISEASL
jgi:hypothetical protein